VGSGPFKFVEYAAADHITLEANLDYYGEGPYVDRVVYRIIPDPGTLEQAFLNDEVDVDLWGLVAADSIPSFEADGRFTIVNKVFPSVYYITFNFGREITGNIQVREAIGKAINREVIVERGLSGAGSPVDTYYTPVIAWANNDEAKAPAFDPEGAQALLDEAGYPVQADGFRFKLVFPYFAFGDSWRNTAQVIQAQLRDVGIDTELVELEIAAWNTRVDENDDYDISMLNGFFGPGPGNLRNRYGTNGGINYWHYSNAEVDQLLAEGDQAVDVETQTEKYHAIQAILAEEIASIPLSAYAGNYVYRSELSGVPLPGDPAGERVGFGNLTLVQRS
ncbi:MAG: ABC transporter substrate-binding protein, partial [Candidatus Methanoperedens sp.]|nr:ABC transporter substrate-binding protein [Candidatus Methanoperedens sp.]